MTNAGEASPLLCAILIVLDMLPDFPQTKDDIRKRIFLAIDQAVNRKAPLLAQIKRRIQHEGKIHSYDRIDAKPLTEGYEPTAVPVMINLSEVPDLVGGRLTAKIDAIAEELARKQMEQFYRKSAEAAMEVGNALDAAGAPLTQDMFFQMLENVHMEFGPDNQLIGQFEPWPEIASVLQKWQDDPMFMTRYQELLNRKRDAWRDRESSRKLVD